MNPDGAAPVRYLSKEWAEAVTELLRADETIMRAAKGRDVTIQQVVTGAPGGEERHYLRIAGGVPSVTVGDAEAPDATVTQSYETAVAIDKGELNAQMAFVRGRIRVEGNLLKLMQLQKLLLQILDATRPLQRLY